MSTRDVDASRASSANATRADAVARASPRDDDGGAMLFVVAAALMAVVAWMLVCLCRVKRAKTRAAANEARAAAEARRRALEEKERAHEAWRGRCAAFAMPGGEVMIAIETRDDDDDDDDETIENGDDARARDAVTCVVTLREAGDDDDAKTTGDDANV